MKHEQAGGGADGLGVNIRSIVVVAVLIYHLGHVHYLLLCHGHWHLDQLLHHLLDDFLLLDDLGHVHLLDNRLWYGNINHLLNLDMVVSVLVHDPGNVDNFLLHDRNWDVNNLLNRTVLHTPLGNDLWHMHLLLNNLLNGLLLDLNHLHMLFNHLHFRHVLEIGRAHV